MKTVERDRGCAAANAAWAIHDLPRRPVRPKAAVVELAAWAEAILSDVTFEAWRAAHGGRAIPQSIPDRIR